MAAKTENTVAVSETEVVDVTTGELVRLTDSKTAHEIVAAQVTNLTNPSAGAVAHTLTGGGVEERKTLYRALNDAEKMSDHLNEEFTLAHVVAQAIEILDNESKEMVPAVRTVLITKDGKAFAAVSNMLYQSVQNILALFGEPSTWPEGLKVKVVQKNANSGRRFYTISVL